MNKIYRILLEWDLKSISTVREKTRINGEKQYLIEMKDSRHYLLKIIKDTEKLLIEEDLLIYLLNYGIKVPVLIRTVKNELFIECCGVMYCVYTFIVGEHLEYKNFQQMNFAAEQFGLILANLHKALAGYMSKEQSVKNMSLQHSIFNWAIPQINKKMENERICNDINKIRDEISDAIKNLPVQFIHRDFHGENIMFSGNEFTGIIDFETSMRGYRIFDIGYILTSMLISDFSNIEYRKNWLSIIPKLIEYYIGENFISTEERKAIFYMLISIQLIFTAFYLNNNDIEMAKKNLRVCYWLLDVKKQISDLLITDLSIV